MANFLEENSSHKMCYFMIIHEFMNIRLKTKDYTKKLEIDQSRKRTKIPNFVMFKF